MLSTVPRRMTIGLVLVALVMATSACSTTSSQPGAGASTPFRARPPATGTQRLSLARGSWFDQVATTDSGIRVSGEVESNPRAGSTCVSAVVTSDPLRLGPTDQGSCGNPVLSGQTVDTVNSLLPHSYTATLAIDHIDPQTGHVVVGPVVMTYAYVSDTRPVVADADGSLWIYDVATTAGPEVIQASASTGVVEDTVPVPGLYRPLLAADDDGLWIGESDQGGECSGCGPPSLLYHVSSGATSATVAVADSTSVACWMVADGHHLWVGVGADQACVVQSIRRFDGPSAQPVFDVSAGPFDQFNVVGGEANGLWTVLPYPPTSRLPTGPYRLAILRIDPDTGRESVAKVLPPMALPVYYWNTSQLWTFLDGAVYLLEPPIQPNHLGFGTLVRVKVSS